MLRQLAISGLVWLTAFSTLIAGSPHLSCRCPDGNLKLFCFSLAPSPQECCAAKSSSADAENKPSCCHKKDSPAAKHKTRGQGPSFTADSCQQNLVQAEAAAVRSHAPLDAGLAIPLNSFAVSLTPQAVSRVAFPKRHGSLPTDLVLLLQHFLI
jgi:hypothetical protein